MKGTKAGDVLAVGATVWVFDTNRRVYAEDGRGGPIWREHWRPARVIGETRVSWLIGPGWHGGKISKREPLPWGIAASEEEVDRRVSVHYSAPVLADMVRRCRDYDTLLAVARVLDAAFPSSPAGAGR